MSNEIKTVFEGDFVDRKSAKLRQVDLAIVSLIKSGVPVDWIEPEKARNHELAHIVAHKNGWTSKFLAQVLVNELNQIVGFNITHEHADQSKLAGMDAFRASIAPIFVKDKPVHPLSSSDKRSALAGLLIAFIDLILNKVKK